MTYRRLFVWLCVTFMIASLKSTKNLCLSHRFFCKIRQIHRFFDAFRQKLQILCRNQARTGWLSCRHAARHRDFAATAGEQRV